MIGIAQVLGDAPPGSDHVTAPGQDDACPDGCGPDHSPSITAQCLAQLVRHASKERLAHKTEVR
jgi:hypothetical protein